MNVTQLNDNALVALAAEQHNRKAFNELVVRYQSPIRRFFLNQTLGNVPLSDDLAQDTFHLAVSHRLQCFLRLYAQQQAHRRFGNDGGSTAKRRGFRHNRFARHLRSIEQVEQLRTNMCYFTANGRSAHRQNSRDNGHGRRNSKVAFVQRKRKNDQILKRKWI